MAFVNRKFSHRAQPAELLQETYRAKHEPLIRFYMVFSGRLSEAVLKRSLALSLEEAPLLSCAFRPSHPKWIEKGYGPGEMLVKKDVPDLGLEAISPFLLSSLDFDEGPQLRVFLLRSPTGDGLCLVASHLALDGLGLKRYGYLLADLYGKCLLDPSYETAYAPSYSLDRSLRQVFSSLSAKKRLALLVPPKKPKPLGFSLPFSTGGEKKAFIVLKDIGSDAFRLSCSRARSAGATVNDLVMAAYARVLSRFSGQKEIEFPCPVSFLPLIKGAQMAPLANLTGVYHCHVVIEAGDSFEKTLAAVSSSFSKQKQGLDCYRGPFFMGQTCRFLPFSLSGKIIGRYIPKISYTNLGIIDEGLLTFGVLIPDVAFISTAVKKNPSFQLSISTYRGTISLSSSFFGTAEDRQLISSLLDEVIKEIASLT